MIDVFEQCQKINAYIEEDKEKSARNELIKLLDYPSNHFYLIILEQNQK